MPALLKLKKRKDFVRVSRFGQSLPSSTVVLQAAKTALDDLTRIGYTTTKKIGSAVVRNRCRRRLRAAAALVFKDYAMPNTDYVLIGRYSTNAAEFDIICRDLKYAVKKVNQSLYGKSKDDKQNIEPSLSVAD